MKNGFTPLEISCSSVRNYKFLTGFTIIEVIIVVLIIGIVACLSIPTFQGAMIKAKFPEMLIAINRLETELALIIAERGWGDGQYFEDRLKDVRDEELESDTFEYGVAYVSFWPDKITDDWLMIWVYVKTVPNEDFVERRIYFDDSRNKWEIYLSHPWGKYLTIPAPEEEISINY